MAPFIAPIISGIFSFFNKKQETKAAKQSAQAKLALKKETGDQNIELTDAEWESLTAKGLEASWKDEYVTIIITSPIVGIMIGAVWSAFDPTNTALIDGTLAGVEKLKDLGLDWDFLMKAVILSAIGLKMWRSK